MRTGREFKIAQKAALTVYTKPQKLLVEWFRGEKETCECKQCKSAMSLSAEMRVFV